MIGRRLEMGETVVADSPWHPVVNGVRAGVVRTFVSVKREPSSCGRERCDALCDDCRADGPYWGAPLEQAEIVTDGGRSFESSADTWLVAPLETKRARAAMKRRKANG